MELKDFELKAYKIAEEQNISKHNAEQLLKRLEEDGIVWVS
jgi:DNA-binding IscR family transcriptional regulator